jgi:short-subunit dehydrogenase
MAGAADKGSVERGRKLAVVTGASSGIGATFARKLAARGFDLLLIARREDRLRALGRELHEQYHIESDALPADLTDPAALEAVAARVQSAPNLGLLVNNAGFGTNGYFFEADVEGQRRMHLLHVVATVRLTHAALVNLTTRAEPATGVINVSSVAAFGCSPLNVSYCATKAWMNRFTEGLALELVGRGSPVSVQALCPGFVLSEFHDVLGIDRSRIPSWMWMTPDFVVGESLRGFDRRKLIVIPGWRYRLLVAVMRVVPGSIQRWVSVRAVARYRLSKSAAAR